MGIYDRAYIGSDRPTYGSSPADWPWAWKLIAINVIIFLLDGVMRSPNEYFGPLFLWGAHEDAKTFESFQLWRFFTYQFLHADIRHLFFNMVCLWFFGPHVERHFGSRRFLLLYFLSGIAGGIIKTILHYAHVLGDGPMVGASGAIYGVTAACAVVVPNLTVMFMLFLPMTIRQLALLVIGLAFLPVVFGGENAGGEACHLGGALVGWMLARDPRLLQILSGVKAPQWVPSPKKTSWKLPTLSSLFDESVSDEELDRLLDKVHNHGIGSLTGREKAKLNRASKQRRPRN